MRISDLSSDVCSSDLRQEPRGEAVIGHHADVFGDAQVAQRAFEAGAVAEVVFRLQHLVRAQALAAGHRPRFGQLQIARARGRERVVQYGWNWVGDVSSK